MHHVPGMGGTQVCDLENAKHVAIIQKDHQSLEVELDLETLNYFVDKALEGEILDQEVGGILVLPDLVKGNRVGALVVSLLHPSSSGVGLVGRLGNNLFLGALPPVNFQVICLV